MTKYLLILAVFAIGLEAKEISSDKPRFKISFPEAAGWAPVDHQSRGAEVQIWSTENQTLSLGLNLTVFDAPMTESKTSFKENAELWERGMMERFSRKISSRFTKLGGHEAYELVVSLKGGNGELFFSNWMIQKGNVTYGVTIVAKDRSKLSGDAASSFLTSLEIAK